MQPLSPPPGALNAGTFRYLFWLLLFLNLLNHALVYLFVNVQHIDSDQFYMWHGAVDYAKGKFYEPRFYGQDYNTFIEALPAVPLLWLGIPVYYALPLSTHLLAFFPFLFPATLLYRTKNYSVAVVILALPLCLSLAYDIMSGIPRGFVGGLFFSSFFILSIRQPENLRFIALNTTMAVAGYFINPNSTLVAVPFLFYLFLHNYKRKAYYFTSLIILPLYLLLHFFLDNFYLRNPDYVVYSLGLEFRGAFFLENVKNIHSRLAHASFFSDKHAWWFFAAFLLLLGALFKHNRRAFYASLLLPVMIGLSMASNKGSDGETWPFYSLSRAYLGTPLFFLLFFTSLPVNKKRIASFIAIAAILFSSYKLLTFRDKLNFYLEQENKLGVHLLKLDYCLEAINFFKTRCETQQCRQLMVSTHFWLNTLLAYGGPAADENFPLCFETRNEHRYWMREGLKNEVSERFIYISPLSDLDERVQAKNFVIQELDNYGLYLITENTLSNGDFISIVLKAEEDSFSEQ